MILLFDSALRVSELLSLNYSSINFASSPVDIRIHGKGDKERIITITERTVGYSSTQIPRVYATPYVEMMRKTMEHHDLALQTKLLFGRMMRPKSLDFAESVEALSSFFSWERMKQLAV